LDKLLNKYHGLDDEEKTILEKNLKPLEEVKKDENFILIKTGKKSWLARKIDQNEAYRLGRIELFDEKIINEKTKEKYDFELKISEKNNNDFKIPISEENKPDFIPNLNKDECSSLKNNKLEIKKT